MKKRLTLATLAAVGVLAIFGTASAAAATEFGDTCSGNEVTEFEPNTYFEITAFGNTMPIAAPTSGIITQWKVSSSIPAAFPQTLKVLRVSGPATVLIVGEATGSVAGGSNTFNTRIPVQAGDRLGLFGTSQEVLGTPVGNLYCLLPGPENQVGGFPGAGGGPGTSVPYAVIEAEARFPVSAVIEPDADNDGFGDETQDKCPQSATTQAACPVIQLSVTATAKKKAATVTVTGTGAANVTVNGVVALGKGQKASLKGGTKAVAPGTFTKFKLKFPAKLTKRLKELPPTRKLTLKITSSAPNIVGAPTKKVLKVKLKGQGPQNH
jgi:hypothetical protein